MTVRRVSFHYVLKDKAGKVLDSSHGGEPMDFIEGVGQIIPGLESGLKGSKTGEKRQVTVSAGEGYGPRDERLVMEVPLTELPSASKIKVGMAYDISLSEDSSHVFRVIEVSKTHATLDGNHPLAGQDLYFDVEVKEAREATKEEIEQAALDDDDEDSGSETIH